MILEYYSAKRRLAAKCRFGKRVLDKAPQGGYCASLFFYFGESVMVLFFYC